MALWGAVHGHGTFHHAAGWSEGGLVALMRSHMIVRWLIKENYTAGIFRG